MMNAETIELSIAGMNCGACQNHVAHALQQVEGVQSVAVNLKAGAASVRGTQLEAAALIAAVEEEGYRAELTPPHLSR